MGASVNFVSGVPTVGFVSGVSAVDFFSGVPTVDFVSGVSSIVDNDGAAASFFYLIDESANQLTDATGNSLYTDDGPGAFFGASHSPTVTLESS